jgi:predicted NAD/FAD-binding protein
MKKLAIIGTGIAGMSAAYFLKDDFDITVFEKNDYIGGHTNTISVNDGKVDCPIDTGFMVFNETTYPNLLKLFKELGVKYKNTDMSFSVRNEKIDLEYNGSNLDGIFSQRKNLFNLKFLKMIRYILKFNAHAPIVLESNDFDSMTIKEYVKFLGLSDYFYNNFLIPMSSAVWSTPANKLNEFPAKSLVRFFYNHGFVGVNTQFQWKTVIGGSREYRNLLISKFKDKINLNDPVLRVKKSDNTVKILTKKNEYSFDKVIIATHGDEALKLIENPSSKEVNILDKFKYQKNIAIVHTDKSVMPKLKKNWSAWNYMINGDTTYTVYYMNKLQGVSEDKEFFININGEKFIDNGKVVKRIEYQHPIFDLSTRIAQKKIDNLNTDTNIYFTGSYYRYGFHEDALLSSVNLCTSILNRDVL